MIIMRKPAIYRASQFFASRKPWPYGIHQASTAMGIILPHLQTYNGPHIMADGDWILEDLSGGEVRYATQREFREDYAIIEEQHEHSVQGEQEREEVRAGTTEPRVVDRATTQDEVQSTGLLRVVRCDGLTSQMGCAVGAGEVKQVSEGGAGCDTGVPSTSGNEKADLDLARQGRVGDADIRGDSWKYVAKKFEKEQKELFQSLGITDKDGVKTS
jgi:hypothetical protein